MDSSAIADRRQTSLAVLADEINAHHQAAEAALNRGLEEAHKCGELLLEAKAACPHGTWQKWLADNFRGSTRSAQCYMRIANHWQEIEAKNADSALLSIDGAVKLLAAPKPKEKPSAPPAAPEPDEPAGGWCLICGSTTDCNCAEKFGSPAEVLGQRDVDEPALVTCRYCHRQVEPDEDGACPRCREPDVDKDDAGPAEIAPPPQSSNRAAKGVGLAHQAINALCGIPKTDGQRERAFEMVADFIEANSPRASSSAWQEARTLVSELGELVNQPAFNVPIRSVKARVRKLHKILGLEYGKGAKQ